MKTAEQFLEECKAKWTLSTPENSKQAMTEAPEQHAEECAAIVQECMENTTKISIMLKAPAAIGKNWKDAH